MSRPYIFRMLTGAIGRNGNGGGGGAPSYTYIYAGGATTKKIYKYDLETLTKQTESPDAGETITWSMVYGDYIYCNSSGYKPTKSNLSDLSVQSLSSTGFGTSAYGVCNDGTYLYLVGGNTTPKIYKYDLSTVTYQTSSDSNGGSGYTIQEKSGSLYLPLGYSTSTTYKYKLLKYSSSDLSFQTSSAVYPTGNPRSSQIIGDYIYFGHSDGYIYKYDLATLNQQDVSDSYGGAILAMDTDGTHLYVGGDTTQKVYKYDIATLSKQAESESYGGSINALKCDGTYVYAAGATTNKIFKYNSALAKQLESASYGGIINTLSLS